MKQHALHVMAMSSTNYLDETSRPRKELAALLEQGFSIVSVVPLHSDELSVSLIVTLQAQLAEPSLG